MQPSLLLTLAVVTIAAGLFVLLGGFGFKKVMFVVTGLFFGAFCTLFSSGTNLFLAAAVIGIFALIALKLQDTFLVLIASAAAAVIGYLVLIRPYFLPSSNILAVIRQFTISVPYYNWPLLVAVTALPFAVISWQGASATLHLRRRNNTYPGGNGYGFAEFRLSRRRLYHHKTGYLRRGTRPGNNSGHYHPVVAPA